MNEVYFIICNDWEGGGGMIEPVFNTRKEAIEYAKKNYYFYHVDIIKGRIIWQS